MRLFVVGLVTYARNDDDHQFRASDGTNLNTPFITDSMWRREKCMSDVCKHVLTFMTNAFCLFYTVPYTLNKNATIFCGCPF